MALAGGIIDTEKVAFGHWLSGFVDGEGCFGIYCYRKGKVKSFVGLLSFEFAIQLREDDRAILEEIRDYLGCGTVGMTSKAKARKNGMTNARDQVKFTCRDLESLRGKIVPHFERFPLRGKKAGDFEIWKRALDLQVLSVEMRGNKYRPIASVPECMGIREEIFELAVQLRESRNPGIQRSTKSLIPLSSMSREN